MGHFVYILRSEENNRHYVGRSQNPERRLEPPNTTSTSFTSRYWSLALAFTQELPAKGEAMAAKRVLKEGKSRNRTRHVQDPPRAGPATCRTRHVQNPPRAEPAT